MTDMQIDETTIGPVAWREYQQATPRGQADATRRIGGIHHAAETGDWAEYRTLTSWAITESARAARWRFNSEDIHAVASAAWWIAQQHDPHRECPHHAEYSQAFNRAMSDNGHTPPDDPCYCNPEGDTTP